MRMLADHMQCSPEAALSLCRQRHSSPDIGYISWVVSNCVFPEAWENPLLLIAPEQMLVETRVALTYGAHPKAEHLSIRWDLLDQKIQQPGCVAVGECGLDGTSLSSLEEQKAVFTKQLHMAAKYNKPIVLHLRNGKHLEKDVFATALQMAHKFLPGKHKVYLHSFTGTLTEFNRWQHRVVNVLAGLSWLSCQGEEGETLAWSLPFECLALESDAPHLSPLPGEPNSPWLLHHQAQAVARARNLPAIVVLEGAALNTVRFFGLEDDWDMHGWVGFVIINIGARCIGGPIDLDASTGLPVAFLIDLFDASLPGFTVMVGPIDLNTFPGFPVAYLIDPLMGSL